MTTNTDGAEANAFDGMPLEPPGAECHDVDNLADRLIAACADAIIVADTAGRIVLWNGGAEAMFGYRSGDAIGQTLDLIIPEPLRARHWDGYRRTMQSGVTHYADEMLAVPGLRQDGSRISLEFRVTLLTDPEGQPEAIAAVVRDVTERWNAEREQRRELVRLQEMVESRPHKSEGPADPAVG